MYSSGQKRSRPASATLIIEENSTTYGGNLLPSNGNTNNAPGLETPITAFLSDSHSMNSLLKYANNDMNNHTNQIHLHSSCHRPLSALSGRESVVSFIQDNDSNTAIMEPQGNSSSHTSTNRNPNTNTNTNAIRSEPQSTQEDSEVSSLNEGTDTGTDSDSCQNTVSTAASSPDSNSVGGVVTITDTENELTTCNSLRSHISQSHSNNSSETYTITM